MVPRLPALDGLDLYAGGRHPGWGTANWIVPLGDAYVELVGIVDQQQARQNAFGRRVADVIERGGGPIGWVVRPGDLDATARRLGLEIREGSRTMPSGERVAWRMAGLDAFVSRPWLPFFIDWSDPGAFPGRTDPPPSAIARIEIEGDVGELTRWLGPHALPLELTEGSDGVTAIVLDGPNGTVTLGRPTSR